MTPNFEDDTWLEPRGPGRWRGAVTRRWYAGNGANGGLVAAQATRAMVAAVGAGRLPRSLTLHFLRAPAEGAIDYEVTVERAGRAVSFVSLRACDADGELLVTGLGVLAADAGEPGLLVQPAAGFPAAPPPEACARVPPSEAGPALLDNYELRPVFGGAPLSGAADTVAGGWLRTAGPRPLDAVALAAYSDAWWPTAWAALTEPAALPTLDLTIHWRAPVPTGAHPWVLCRFGTREIAGGLFDEQGELWSQDGRLLVQSRQLAMLRPPPQPR